MHAPYPGYPGYPTEPNYSAPYGYEGGASFGAEGDPPVTTVNVTSAPIGNGWALAKVWTPDWIKQSLTIAVGVFGGLSLFRMFSYRVPEGKK